jgi:hypothetical protein
MFVFQVVSCLVFPPEILSAFLFSPGMSCHSHLLLLDLIVLIICSFLHSPVASSFFKSEYLPQHPLLERPRSMCIRQRERPSFTPVLYGQSSSSVMYVTMTDHSVQVTVIYKIASAVRVLYFSAVSRTVWYQ